MLTVPPPLSFSLQMASIMGMTPIEGGKGTGGGNFSMDQVLSLLTATISQLGGTSVAAKKKNVKKLRNNNDFTSGCKVEVPHC